MIITNMIDSPYVLYAGYRDITRPVFRVQIPVRVQQSVCVVLVRVTIAYCNKHKQQPVDNMICNYILLCVFILFVIYVVCLSAAFLRKGVVSGLILFSTV